MYQYVDSLYFSDFNVNIPDSVEGITHKVGEVIMQTKIGGGTSGHFGELRGRGAAITDNGKSSGACVSWLGNKGEVWKNHQNDSNIIR